MHRTLLLTAVVLLILLSASAQEQPPIRLRRPIALTLIDQGKRLVIANRDSGTVVLLDTRKQQVIAEKRLGRKLSGLTATSDETLFLATDEEAGELVVFTIEDDDIQQRRRLKVGLSPVSVQVSSNGNLASVALLWPRRLALVDLKDAAKQPVTLDLPFAPRRQLLVPGTDKLIVADAFAGQLAVVDLRKRRVDSIRNLAVHNVRGLALDRNRKSLLFSHQTLPRNGRTTPGDITSGNAVSNNVRKIDLAALLDPWADLSQGDRLYQVGDVERGAGDPAELAALAGDSLVVALAGVNEIALGLPEAATWTRLGVGVRPTALVVDLERHRAYVANTFADSISIVDLVSPKVLAEVRLGALPELTSSERGEHLYFDARLSLDAWVSCHSCHADGHTGGRLSDTFSDGSFGTPKRIVSLLGVKDTSPWGWNGKMSDLETQLKTSLKSTMHGPAPSPEQVRDLVAFLQTLAPPPPLLHARGVLDTDAQQRGRQIFTRQKCATCHAPPFYTSAKTYDVGLRDEGGGTHFNPPSLRGVGQAGPYFHDGRAATLDDVFVRFRHQLTGELSDQERGDLLHFLRGL